MCAATTTSQPKISCLFASATSDNPELIPGIFGGIADGGGFQQGDQTLKSNQSVLGYTHVFTPTTVNVFHVGFNHLHTNALWPGR